MRVLRVVTIKAFDIEVMEHMDRGTGVEIATTSCLPHFTHLEDGTRPCWAWLSYWVEIGA